MLFSLKAFSIEKQNSCSDWTGLLNPVCKRFYQIWTEGTTDLYISGYSWHNTYTYGRDYLRTRKFNELAWGGGLGKGFFDEKKNWQGLFAFAFLDSHKNVEPVIGYAHLYIASLMKDFKVGIGYSVLVTARPDIFNNIPFPGVVPWAGIFFKRFSLKSAYIPGTTTNGNVLYTIGTYSFDT